MFAPVVEKIITLDELRATAGAEAYKGMEIIDGVWTPKGGDERMSIGHGKYGVRMIVLLDTFVEEHELGEVYMSDTIYVLEVFDNGVRKTRKPDVSFVSAARVNRNIKDLYFQAPDLAVEIISPSDTPKVIYDKLSDYFTYGTQQVWLVYPVEEKIVVHQANGTATTYRVGESVSGGDLLPGFVLDLASLF